MKTIAIGNFKATCLSLLDAINKSKKPIIVTKRGEPLVEIVPVNKKSNLKGSVVYEEDIVSPALNLEDWEACK